MNKSTIPGMPFVLLTERLIIVPTPIAVDILPYVDLFRAMHANPDFCAMGFGPDWPPISWTQDECRDFTRRRDIAKGWHVTGMGDFAVGLRKQADFQSRIGHNIGRQLTANTLIVDGDDYDKVFDEGVQAFAGVDWVGYAGVRHATWSIPRRGPTDPPLPPMEEMIEIRYGVAPEHWGKRIAGSGADAVMDWAVKEKGTRRFIAETEKGNSRSGRVLERMGFTKSDTDYWKNEDEQEWEKRVADALSV
jgi:RimJ/RimL family protein N-acetyltransferase